MSMSAPKSIMDNGRTACLEAPAEMSNTDRHRPPPVPVSVEWHRWAAGQGNTWSQFLLGVVYSIGDGVSQDDEEAFMWFTLAVKAGHTEAVEMRNILIERMTGAQIEAGLRRAWQLAARFGCQTDQFANANREESGWPSVQDSISVSLSRNLLITE